MTVRRWVVPFATLGLAVFGSVPVAASAPPTCTIEGTSGPDQLTGTPGDDVICGRGGADGIVAGGGDDVVFGGAGNDTLEGGPGDDRLVGGGGLDSLFDGGGDDVTRGGPGTDIVYGGHGDDLHLGGPGADLSLVDFYGVDRVRGGRGADNCLETWDSRSGDVIVGGPGRDRWFADASDLVRSVEFEQGCFAE